MMGQEFGLVGAGDDVQTAVDFVGVHQRNPDGDHGIGVYLG